MIILSVEGKHTNQMSKVLNILRLTVFVTVFYWLPIQHDHFRHLGMKYKFVGFFYVLFCFVFSDILCSSRPSLVVVVVVVVAEIKY